MNHVFEKCFCSNLADMYPLCKTMNILGISRSPQFSPNSCNRDKAIFDAVASRLQRSDNEVSVISEDFFVAVDLSEFDMVFSMARGNYVLQSLADAERTISLPVYNSALALLQSMRSRLVVLLRSAGIPQPSFQVIEPLTPFNPASLVIPFPLWAKRGDACAQCATDVRYIMNETDFLQAIADFEADGVSSVVVEEHVSGDLIKFYGVEGSDFFHFSYPSDGEGFSKFGLEQHNGLPSRYEFSVTTLKTVADDAARAARLTIYGGDAIVRPDGTFVIIDFNDWPSFSACRKQAAKAIAQRILRK